MGFHAIFDVIKETPEYIYIKDVGHTTSRSVTNDAEWVLQELALEYGIKSQRIFYVDSDGNTDEIVHNEGRFIGFKPGHAGVAL